MSLQVAGIIVAAVIVVLWGRSGSQDGPANRSWTRGALADADAVSDVARLRASLDEISFDRASGKLAEDDYQALRATYEAALQRAAAAPPRVVATSVTSSPGADADVERLVARARAEQGTCPTCGPRPEPAPPYCSNCGLHLRACRSCGVRPTEIGARYCSNCGTRLAA